jgi:hypothetical protein
MSGQHQRPMPTTTVHPIHFEDFDGTSFERLVFAYHARTDRWLSLEWFGQSGSDRGRDILGTREVDGPKKTETVCILCANWQHLTRAKIKDDIDKVLTAPTKVPEKIRIVSRHDISAGLRDDAKAYAKSRGIYQCELWSGKELEEFIRTNAESLLHRFVQGEAFPDTANDLLMFAWGSVPIDDNERLAMIALAFDRPAFGTPFHQESSLPAFRKAINDTIQVLQTGIWQTRDDAVIRRLPKIGDIEDESARQALKATLNGLVKLRSVFDSHMRDSEIQHCQCRDADCPTYVMSHRAEMDLTRAREEVLSSFRQAYPRFELSIM